MIHIGLVNLNRSWLLVLLLALGSSTSGGSKSLYPWNDASALCEWQATSGSYGLQLPFYGIEEDTISPALPDFVCDAVCPDFQVTWISIDADCGQSNGSATVTPVGLPAGTEFVYTWEGGISTGPTAENLAPGVYKVTIGISELLEDQSLRDCLIETEVVIDTKEGPTVEVRSITAGNCAMLSGGVKLDISGGTPPYQISWGDGGSNTLSADGTVSISGLAPGDYTFIVRDAAGCLTSLPVTIPLAQNPISLTGTPPSLCSSDDGTITVTMEEGFPPYTITLNDGLEITTNNNPYTFEGLPVGLYTVKVEYGFVCEAEASIELNMPGFECNEGWSVFDPVCPGDPAYLYFDGSGTGSETYQVRQVNAGFLLASVPGNEAVFIEVQYGDYEIRRISTADNCFCEFRLSVEPVTLEAQLTVIDGTCEPGNIIPGSIALNAATGGTPPYTLEVTDLNGNPVDASNLNEGSYIATVLDANNCPLSDTVAVEGGTLSGGIEEQEVVVCEGDSFQPSFENAGNPNLIFSWSPTTGLSDSTIGNPVITPTEDITYVLNITDPNCGSFSDTLVIDFVPGLNLSVDGNAFQFGQDEITITVSSDSDEAVYTWFQNDGTIVDDDGNDTFVLAADDLASPYTVVGEVNGCPDTLTFPVLPPPEADYTISVPDIDICEGEDAVLTATIIPDTILIDSIVWNDAQGETVGQGSELVLSGLPAGSYTYTATAFSLVGLAQTNALVTVRPLPGIDAQPDGVLSLCTTDQGNLVELTATATGYPDSMVVWTASDGAVLGNGAMVMVQAEAGTSQYIATLSSACGEVSDTVTIEVDTEPVLPALPDTLTLCINQDTVFDLSSYAYDYTWSDCDGQFITANDDDLQISGSGPGEQCYIFSASNSCGTVEKQITVYVIDAPEIDAQPDTTIQLCAPITDSLTLAATATGFAQSTIAWFNEAGDMLGTGGTLGVLPTAGTAHYIGSISAACGTATDTVTIVVDDFVPPLPPGLPDTLKICVGNDIIIDLSTYGYPYVWSDCEGQEIPVNNNTIEISGNEVGEQCFQFSASNACGAIEEPITVYVVPEQQVDAQPNDTLRFCAPAPDTCLTATVTDLPDDCIEWTDLNGNLLGTGGELCVTPGAGLSQYIASVSGLACVTPDTITVIVDSLPMAPPALPDTLTLCIGQDTVFDVSSYGFPYAWSSCDGQVIQENSNEIEINATTVGEECYTFTASNACDTVEVDVIVYVIPEPAIDAQPDTTIFLCGPVNTPIAISAITDGFADSDITWSSEDGTVLGTGPTLSVLPVESVNQYIASTPSLTCGSASDTVTIVVETLPPPPPVALPDTLKLCVGDSAVIDLSSYGFPYTWSECGGAELPVADDEIIILGEQAGEFCYEFGAMNACGMTSAQVIVYVVPEQTVDAQPDLEIELCAPVTADTCLTATVTGLPGGCIEWTDFDGNVLGTGNELCVTPPEGTSYYIAGVPGLGCITSDTVTIVVETLPPPPPVALPDTLKLCVGDEVVIDLSSYGFPYTWSECGGAELPVADDEIIILGEQAGEFCYEFGAMNACGMTSAQVIVYVVPEQTVDAQPDLEIELCAPVTADTCLTATVTGLPGGCIEWTDFDGNVLGTGNELCVTPPEGTSYYIAGVPGLDCITSDTVTIVVETLPPPPPVALPDTLKLCVGDSAVIDLSSYGFPYTWSECGGAELPVADDEIIILGEQAGEFCYEFGASNACGMTSAQVIVYVVPEQTVDAQPDLEIELCAPVTADTCLTATVTGLPGGCIEWTDFDGNVLGTGNELCVTPPEGTSYYIAGVPGLDCITSDTVTIVVETLPPPPPVALPDTLKLCVGDEVVIDLSSYGFPYTWSECGGAELPVADDEIIILGEQAGEFCYEFGASNACGMTSAQVIVYVVPEQTVDAQPDLEIELCAPVTTDTCLTATVTGLPGGCIEWTDFDGNVLGTGNELCVTPPEGTSYYIAGVPGLGCITSDTVTIVVETLPPPPPVALPDTLKLCVGDEAVIDLSSYGFPYTWSECGGAELPVADDEIIILGEQAGEFCYEFGAMNACGMTSAQVIVYVVPEQTVDAQPDLEIELCAPVTTDTCLTATVTGLPGGCIEWTDFDGNVLGTGNELCVTPPEGTSYYIAGVPGLGCITSDTVTIVVETLPPPPPVALPDTLKLCVGDEVVIDLSSYGFPYTWSECGGAELPVADDEIIILGEQAGEFCYEFGASNACGMTSAQVIVYVVPEQTVDAQPDLEIELCAPVTADTCLTATVTGLPGGCIEWTDFDGNVLGTGNELCVTPPEGTSYYIAGVPGLGCITSDTVTIVVETLPPPPPVALPDTLKLCVGDEVVIDLSSYGFPYTWSECGGAELPVADDEIIILGEQAGEFCYEFGAMNACGMTSAQVIVYVVPEQTVDAQPDLEIELCAPVTTDTCLTATVTGLPGGCIEWTDFDGNVLGTGNELCVTPPEGTSYYIAGVPGLGCITSDTVTIVVETLPPPPPVALPDTLKLCVGDEVVIDLSSYGFPYTWSECGGAELPVADDEIIILGEQAGEFCYEFGASNACGMTSAQVIVYVVPEQTVDAQPDLEIELCAPVTADTCLTATVTGLPGGCIEWTDFDGNVLGTGNELCVTPPEGTSYYIAGVPGLGCITSDTVTIVVETLPPPPPVALPDTLKLCVGDSAVIDLSSYGFPYTWSECGGAEIPVDNDEIVIPAADSGEYCYTFTATNGCGTVEAEVIVYVVPDQQVEAQPDVDVLLCAPVEMDTCLTATVSGLPDECIEWTDLEGTLLGTGGELCVTPPVGISQYIASVPGLDCIISDTVTVMVDTIPPVLPPSLPDTVLLCLNDTLSVGVGDYDYPFVWQDENGDTVAINEDLVLIGAETGTASFLFEATNGCGVVSDTLVQVTIDSAAIEIMPSVDTLVVCDSAAIQLSALAPLGQAVVWTDGAGNVIDTAISIEIMPQPGSSIYIANPIELGCVTSDTIVVEYVPEDLMLEINTPSPLICLGDEASLEAALDPEDVAATISWYDEAFEFIGEGAVIAVTPDRGGLVSYFAVAENACAVDTASIEIEVETLEVAIIGGDTSICTGDFATLEVVGCDNCTYEWTPEDRLTNPDAAITDAEPLRPSTYQVIVTGEVCRDTLTTTVDVGTCERCEVDKVFIADAFTPNGDQNNDMVCIQSEVMDQFSEIELMIYNRWGQEVFRSNDMQNLCWDGSYDGEDLPPDVYGYFMRIVCPGEEGEPDQVFNRQGNITLLR